MKKIMFLLTILLLFPVSVLAAGSIAPSTRSITINKGSSATFSITANNAVGRVDIASANAGVATINKSSEWLENSTVVVTVTGVSVGTTSVNVNLSDAATFDEEELTGNYSITVNVVEPSSAPSGGNNGGTTNNKPSSNLSKNNSIKNLEVKGYELQKIDNNKYELTVNNNVTEVEIIGSAEDSKAKITGLGKVALEIGENNFEVIVIAESGAKNEIQIKITRKDGYYLADLNEVLKSNIKDASIIINADDILTKEHIEAIKNSNKVLTFNYYNEEKILIYSWTIDGAKIDKISELSMNVSFNSENIEKIGKLSNYAEGLYLNFAHSGNLPKGTKIKVYVGDKFTNDTKVNIYHFSEEKTSLDFVESDLIVSSGYIEFDIEHCSDYFVTRSAINNQTNGINIFIIVSIIELVIIIGIVILDVLKVILY